MVYAIDKNGKKFSIDKTLDKLETELDKITFFRVNRQYIVNISFVKSCRPYEKVKLKVDLIFRDNNYFIIVSQNTAPVFRKWIAEEL